MFEEFIMIPGGGVKIASCERQQARQMICRRVFKFEDLAKFTGVVLHID